MTTFKKILAAALGMAIVPAVIVSADDNENIHYEKISRTSSTKQDYQFNGISLENFYDYGTWWAYDDAYISAQVISGDLPYAYIYFKDYDSKGKWDSKGGEGYTFVNYNPYGVDYLQGGSFARSKSDNNGIQLTVYN